jgi:hypothetical protein
MSTSALASARRRRAGVDTPVGSQIMGRSNKVEPVEAAQPTTPNQPLTPLVILQQHEIKIRQLEGLITKEEDYEELFQQIDEKIDKLFTVNFELFNDELNGVKSSIERMNGSSIGINNVDGDALISNMNVLIDEKIASQNVKIDEFKTSQTQLFSLHTDNSVKVVDLLTSNMESKIALIDSKTQHLESKIGEFANRYENNKNHNSDLTKFESELNSIKTTIITNQSHMLELSNSVNFIKDALKIHKEMIDNINASLESIVSNQEHRNSTRALLSSLMSNNLFGVKNSCCDIPNNMGYCCETEDNDITINYETTNDSELNLDMNINELIMDENQIAELLEIKNFDTININNNDDELEENCISVIEVNDMHDESSIPNDIETNGPTIVETNGPTIVETNGPTIVETSTPN